MSDLVDIKKIELTVEFEEGGKQVTAIETWEGDAQLMEVVEEDGMLGDSVRKLIREDHADDDEEE
jgi:hypothetical protein